MKRIFFTFLILSVIGLMSCRKSGNNLDIKQYDQQQITNYIAANGLTGMIRDTSGGDTTGIYYKIINPGNTAKPLDYPDSVSFVYTLRSFDNKFIAPDTSINHYAGYVGHVTPNGLLLSIRNILKYKGASMRVLIPSHLGFGLYGTGQGSKTVTNGRIAGNQCLDYYVNAIDNQRLYDDLVIQNYLKANNLTGYKATANGVYYKITIPGTGIDPVGALSTITCTYTGFLLNNTVFDQNNVTGGTSFTIPELTPGVAEALQQPGVVVGTYISIIAPSALEYGAAGSSGGQENVPSNACLRFDFAIITVSP